MNTDIDRYTIEPPKTWRFSPEKGYLAFFIIECGPDRWVCPIVVRPDNLPSPRVNLDAMTAMNANMVIRLTGMLSDGLPAALVSAHIRLALLQLLMLIESQDPIETIPPLS